MANSVLKTERVGAKNGGGYWGRRVDAKKMSSRVRRAVDRIEAGCGHDDNDQ